MKKILRKILMSFGVVTFLMIVCFILYVVVKFEIQDARYNSIKEITTGKEITIIAEEYVNAHIDSAEWNDNVLECTKADSITTGMFAGSQNKQYYVFKGLKKGKTEIVFLIDKFAKRYKKTYEVEIFDDLDLSVMSIEEEEVSNVIAPKLIDEANKGNGSNTEVTSGIVDSDEKLEGEKTDIREGVQVILDREYSSYVCEFMNAYMAGKAYIPENSMSAVTYEPTDPGYFLCLDFNNDGVDEVFVSYYADADAWYMIGNVARLEGTTSTFSHYNQESSCLMLMREMLGDAENVIHNSIYFFTGDWHDLNCYEQYEKICVYENQDGVESNIEKNISCMLHKDGVSENISEEIWEKAFNTPMVRLSSNKERIFRITQENVDYYLRVE